MPAAPRTAATSPPAVAAGKLAPPRVSGPRVVRTALLARLVDARRHRCVVLRGPAGTGKTTLLAAWRQALLPLGFDVAWLSCAPEDQQLAPFLDSLLASLAQVDGAIAREAQLLAGLLGDAQRADDADAVERVVIALVRGIAAHGRELVLVLDEAQHLAQPAVHEALQWLLDYAPANLHLALGTRAPAGLSLERLRARGQLLEIGAQDLRWSPAESGEFLQQQLGAIDARSARLLHEWTDGWIAGLALYAAEWKRKPPAPGAEPQAPLRNARSFTRYFEIEVLDRLTADELDLLTRAAACSRFCAALCAALRAGDAGLPPVLRMLERLARESLFVEALDSRDSEAWYRLHPLLRETLLARFAQWDAPRRRAVHARAQHWWHTRGQFDEAVRHALQAGQPAQAAALVEQCATSLFMRGERRTLFALLQQLPAGEVEHSLPLCLWTARAQLHQRALDDCERTLARVQALCPPDAALQQFHVAMLRTTLAVQRDDSDRALALLPSLAVLPPAADAMAAGGRANLLSWLHLQRGDIAAALQVQAERTVSNVEGAALLGSSSGALQGRCLVGLGHALQGDMRQAERVFRAVADEAVALGRAGAEAYYLAIALLGDVLYERDEAEQARVLLQDKVDVLERITIPDAVLRVHRMMAAAHALAGRRQEALAWLDRLEEHAARHGLPRLLAHSLADQVRLRLPMGQTGAVLELLERLDALAARHPGPRPGTPGEIFELAARARIHQTMAQGDLALAMRLLDDRMASCEAHGRHRQVVHLRMRAAVVEARRGREAESRAHLLEALRRGHRLGLLRSLLDADPGGRRLIAALAGDTTLDPVLAFYAQRLAQVARTPRAPEPAAPVAPLAAEAFSERELEVLRLLAQALPNKKIARALNLSPETVKWYLSRIYGKLGVSGRDEAVARVRDRGLGLGLGLGLGESPAG